MMERNIVLLLDFMGDSADVKTMDISLCKKSVFLIGSYRSKDKKQLEWITGKSSFSSVALYNVRSDKSREGWVNPNNPKVNNPDIALLYDYENPENYCAYRVTGSKEASERDMVEMGYPEPKGSYLVYSLCEKIEIRPFTISDFLNKYQSLHENYVKGKPIFLTGAEIAKVISKGFQKKEPQKRKPNKEATLAGFPILPSRETVVEELRPTFSYMEDALTSIDLFSGCGGLTKGFSMSGVRSIMANDVDENCEKTFTRNFPDTPFLCKDISLIEKCEVDSLLKGLMPDIIIGGPPCQGFSLANKRRNKIKDDPRNKLFYGFVKFINWYSPKAFVMENVKGLLSMQNGEVIKTIVEEFTNAGDYGYNVDYKVLKASDYGVPQNRERVILIGFRKDLNLQPKHPAPYQQDHPVTVDEAIGDLPQIKAGQGSDVQEYPMAPQNAYQRLMRKNSHYVLNHVAMKHTARLIARFEAIKPGQDLLDVWETHGALKRGAPNEKSTIKFHQNNQRLFGDQPAPTIAASFQSNFVHPHLNRNFTAREGARLQSFPDDFVFEGMRTKMSWEKGLSQYQQIGNAVPVLLAKAIADSVVEQLKPQHDEKHN